MACKRSIKTACKPQEETMNDIEIIWLLLGIGYGFGFCIIAYFGITGTNEVIDFQNRMKEKYKDKNE